MDISFSNFTVPYPNQNKPRRKSSSVASVYSAYRLDLELYVADKNKSRELCDSYNGRHVYSRVYYVHINSGSLDYLLSSNWIPDGLRYCEIVEEIPPYFVNVGGFAVLDVVFDKSLRVDHAAEPMRFYKQLTNEIQSNRRSFEVDEQLIRRLLRNDLRVSPVHDFSAL
jgi:hypothetical protein